MAKILVVDDEKNIVELIKFTLTKQKWDVDVAYDGHTAVESATRNKPDLIILDVMLPGIDGFEVCRVLKANQETADIPIIMLSAKSEELDKVLGLEIGADDYLTKPFSPRELTARIKVQFRKMRQDKKEVAANKEKIQIGNILMNLEKYEIKVNGIEQSLTLKEFELLKLLMTNQGKVFTREFLLQQIWNYDYTHDTRTVDVHIRHLRIKIEEDPANPEYILTVRGVGYRFKKDN